MSGILKAAASAAALLNGTPPLNGTPLVQPTVVQSSFLANTSRAALADALNASSSNASGVAAPTTKDASGVAASTKNASGVAEDQDHDPTAVDWSAVGLPSGPPAAINLVGTTYNNGPIQTQCTNPCQAEPEYSDFSLSLTAGNNKQDRFGVFSKCFVQDCGYFGREHQGAMTLDDGTVARLSADSVPAFMDSYGNWESPWCRILLGGFWEDWDCTFGVSRKAGGRFSGNLNLGGNLKQRRGFGRGQGLMASLGGRRYGRDFGHGEIVGSQWSRTAGRREPFFGFCRLEHRELSEGTPLRRRESRIGGVEKEYVLVQHSPHMCESRCDESRTARPSDQTTVQKLPFIRIIPLLDNLNRFQIL